jgi:hypothetical protein
MRHGVFNALKEGKKMKKSKRIAPTALSLGAALMYHSGKAALLQISPYYVAAVQRGEILLRSTRSDRTMQVSRHVLSRHILVEKRKGRYEFANATMQALSLANELPLQIRY